MDLDRRLHADVEDLGVKPPWRATVHASGEHDRDPVRAAERELIGDRALKPCSAGGGAVEHARVGDLELTERQLVAIAAVNILGSERAR